LLAGIHLAVAGAMVLMMEARDEKAMRDADEGIMERAVEAAIKPPAAPELVNPAPVPASPEAPANPENPEGEQTVSFPPCGMWVHYPPQVVVLQGADMPALALAGWEMECPLHWSIAGKLRGISEWPPSPSWMATQRQVDVGFGLLIALQWFLMGAFPLLRTRGWRELLRDPGSFITVCSVSAALFALIPSIDGVSQLPSLFAMLGWYWWFGFLISRLLNLFWRQVVRKRTVTA